jgi:hypothetical protein
VKKLIFSEKSRNFDEFWDLLKKTPAENACAFGETGVYVLLSIFMRIYRNFEFFCLFPGRFSCIFARQGPLSSARTIFV